MEKWTEKKYTTVQSIHTPGIRDPDLLSEIGAVRRLYWPGKEEGKELLRKYDNFEEFEEECMTEDGHFDPDVAKSDFIVGWSLITGYISDFEEEYLDAADEDFMDRVHKGIATFYFAPDNDEEDIKEIKEHLEYLPEESFDEVMRHRENSELVDVDNF